jgi:hypothetical protein
VLGWIFQTGMVSPSRAPATCTPPSTTVITTEWTGFCSWRRRCCCHASSGESADRCCGR